MIEYHSGLLLFQIIVTQFFPLPSVMTYLWMDRIDAISIMSKYLNSFSFILKANLYDPPNEQCLIRGSISSSNEENINVDADF